LTVLAVYLYYSGIVTFDVPTAVCVTELSFGTCDDVLYSEIRTDVSEKPTTVTCTHNESGGFLCSVSAYPPDCTARLSRAYFYGNISCL